MRDGTLELGPESLKARILKRLWLAFLVVIVVGSLLPGSVEDKVLSGLLVHPWDKVAHFSAYSLLAFFPVFSRLGISTPQVGAGLAAMGLLLELLQTLVPGRAFELGDLLANTCGVLFGLAIAYLLKTHAAARRPS